MANIRLIKGRIKSAKNIAQITRAMELVAASKMKRAQLVALASKLYANKIHEMVMRLAIRTDAASHPLLVRPKTLAGKRLVVVIATNKGLCGGLNTNLFRWLLREGFVNKSVDTIVLGKKGLNFVLTSGAAVKADFSDTVPFVESVPALTQLVTDEYLAGHYDGVDLVYNEFVSAIKQIPRKKTILPLTIEATETGSGTNGEFLIEPAVGEVFEALIPHYLENQVRDAILQAEASEHSARMVAMRSATDNALSLMGDLTLLYNKARQEKITYEITDMVTARLAVEH